MLGWRPRHRGLLGVIGAFFRALAAVTLIRGSGLWPARYCLPAALVPWLRRLLFAVVFGLKLLVDARRWERGR